MSFPVEVMIEWAVKYRARLKNDILFLQFLFSSLLLGERLPQIMGERDDRTGAQKQQTCPRPPRPSEVQKGLENPHPSRWYFSLLFETVSRGKALLCSARTDRNDREPPLQPASRPGIPLLHGRWRSRPLARRPGQGLPPVAAVGKPAASCRSRSPAPLTPVSGSRRCVGHPRQGLEERRSPTGEMTRW